MRIPVGLPLGALIVLAPLATSGRAVAAPSTASQQPYLGGIWINPYGAHNQKEPSDPEFVRPPFEPAQYTPKYAAKHQDMVRIWEEAELGKGVGSKFVDSISLMRQVYCLPYGMPEMMLAETSIDIQQTADRITMVGEVDREIRHIWLDRKQLPLEEVDLGYFGRSVGHWQGDTLIVNTIGIKEGLYGPDFLAHSDRMVITERFRLHKPDILYDDITVSDSLALKKPQTYRAIYGRAQTDYEPAEYVCDNFHHEVDANGKIDLKMGNP
jgi:hypothetical protein